MPKFKVGDKVIALNTGGLYDESVLNPVIISGKKYHVKSYDEYTDWIEVLSMESGNSDECYGYRFELAEEQVLENSFDKAVEQTGAALLAKSLIEKETQMTAEQLREEIIRIDARIEEAKKDIENAQTERNSLVEKLREKGFEMVTSRATDTGYVKPTQYNVELGDVLILTANSLNGILPKDTEVYVNEIDYEEGTTCGLYVVQKDLRIGDWVYTDCVKFKE